MIAPTDRSGGCFSKALSTCLAGFLGSMYSGLFSPFCSYIFYIPPLSVWALYLADTFLQIHQCGWDWVCRQHFSCTVIPTAFRESMIYIIKTQSYGISEQLSKGLYGSLPSRTDVFSLSQAVSTAPSKGRRRLSCMVTMHCWIERHLIWQIKMICRLFLWRNYDTVRIFPTEWLIWIISKGSTDAVE